MDAAASSWVFQAAFLLRLAAAHRSARAAAVAVPLTLTR